MHPALLEPLVVDRADGGLDGTGADGQLLSDEVPIAQSVGVALDVAVELAELFPALGPTGPEVGEFREQGVRAAGPV